MKTQVLVRLKPGVLDVQGKAIERNLGRLGLSGIQDIRVGKVIEFDVDVGDKEQARQIAEQLASKLLANTVIENFEIVTR